jgi:hypothetical protein
MRVTKAQTKRWRKFWKLTTIGIGKANKVSLFKKPELLLCDRIVKPYHYRARVTPGRCSPAHISH